MRYFPRLIPQLRSIAEVVVVLDDHSTDGSFEYLTNQSLVSPNFMVLQLTDKTYNGGRDWNVLYKYAEQFKPDWIFCPDTDERLEEPAQENIKRLVEQSGRDVLGWSFPFYYLWNDDRYYRNQGMYHNTRVIRLFRYDSKLHPPERVSHSTGVPDELDRRLIRVSDVRMWHYGYMLPEDRKAKFDFYTNRDQDPMKAGAGSANYSHMVDTPTDVVPVPMLSDWRQEVLPRSGDFLAHSPLRFTIGGPFPTAFSLESVGDITLIRDASVDEIRYFYVLDSEDTNYGRDAMKEAMRVLRPGGRIEVITTDYVAICQQFIDASDTDKRNHQSNFFQTPLRLPVRTMYHQQLVSQLMQDTSFEDPQRVPIPDMGHRLHMIAYRPGGEKWI